MKTLLAFLGIMAAMAWLPVALYLYWVCDFNIFASFAAGFFLSLLATGFSLIQWFALEYFHNYRQRTSARPH